MDEKQIKYGHLIRSNIDTDIIELIDNVNNRGGHVYIVGGFIRDSLLMRPSTDMDLEVHNLEFDELCDILKNYSSLDIQGQFGVIKCHYFKNMEIAIPRKETKIGLKHTDFKVNFDPFMGTYEASLRRDFTINSMMYDTKNFVVIDHHLGLVDLNEKKIKHVSSQFIDDQLRMLRGIRFSSQLGFKIDETTLSIFEKMSINNISHQRVINELKLFLEGENLSVAFDYFNLYLAQELFGGQIDECSAIINKLKFFQNINISKDAKLLMMNLLLCVNYQNTNSYIEYYLPNKKVKKQIKIILRLKAIKNICELYDYVYEFGSNLPSIYAYLKAVNTNQIESEEFILNYEMAVKFLSDLNNLKLEFNGHYLMRMGYHGQAIGIEQKKLILNELKFKYYLDV